MAHQKTWSRSAYRLIACQLLVGASAFVFAETTRQPTPLDSSGCVVTKCFQLRSQGRDSARKMVGTVGYTHQMHTGEENGSYAYFTITPEYSQSFKPTRIGRCLFGTDLVACGKKSGIRIQGLGVPADDGKLDELPARNAKAWLADYFYLPRDYDSTVNIDPEIKNFILDFDLYMDLDQCFSKCWEGLYLRLHGPIVHSRWDLGMCEDITKKGTANHPFGYFTPDELERSFLLSSFSAYASGCAPGDGSIRQTWTTTGGGANSIDPSTTNPVANQNTIRNWDTVFEPLRYARMDTKTHEVTSFADLRAELGLDVMQSDDYHLGFNIQAAAPTGTRKDPCFLFAPMVGNGHHWELGAGMTGHYMMWRCNDDDKQLSFHTDISVTHLFNTWQKRTFELKGKPNSAYILAQRGIDKKVVTPTGATFPDGQPYTTRAMTTDHVFAFAPLANISTVDVKVSVDVQVDVVGMVNFQACGFSFDLGYNFWMRSCEKIKFKKDHNKTACDIDSAGLTGFGSGRGSGENGKWSLKGVAAVFAYDITVPGPGLFQNLDPFRIPVSQNGATIHAAPRGSAQLRQIANSGVDNPEIAHDPRLFGNFLNRGPDSPDPTDNPRIFTSIVPKTLGCNDLDYIRSRGLSHKIFGHVSYEFDFECAKPIIGLGGSAEFGNHDSCADNCPKICDNSCVKCSLSQWGIWLKGGISFS